MKRQKQTKYYILYGLFASVIILLVVPSALVFLSGSGASPLNSNQAVPVSGVSRTPQVKQEEPNPYIVRVFRVETGKVEDVPIEKYIEGVVAAEEPAEFELEALKAQALAARTYIVRRILGNNFNDVPKGAYVTDTVKHQVYYDDSQLRNNWGRDYSWKQQRVHQAVVETTNQILTYGNKPINATFFSTSNGYTESAEDYWGQKIPYLQSVAVPWDKDAPHYEDTVSLPLYEFERKLRINMAQAAMTGGSSWQHVLSYTPGKRVGKIRIGDKEYTGREIREKLGLYSTQFSFSIEKNNVIIHTKGYGHGVGMSQWGANGMAKQGKAADDIVRYFYRGVSVESDMKWLKAKNS
ncbi:stage II sporulation protein D [Aneurinibacillus terranovensis]|uniref:stage II sporulation protein D n=1 Tax=Aneurinibacillus terranovensis TaxID=278991 RepID=UPI000418D227|nr:stage II sporulation protein D [Aneurinibacillus terranovensis]